MIIATASDDTFTPGLLALLHSAHSHNPEARFLIIDMGMSSRSRFKLDAMIGRFGISAVIVKSDRDAFVNLPNVHRFTRSAYARLLIPELLRNENRALYIDADAVVTCDLGELWAKELDDFLIAAARDEFIAPDEAARAGVDADSYFNSGVLLMNLDLWRSEGIAGEAMAMIEKDHSLTLPDQTALNAICRGRVMLIERRWNLFAASVADLPVTEPGIIHFTGIEKPWRRRDIPLFDFYSEHARRAGVELNLVSEPRTLRQIRKSVFGLLGFRSKYWRPLLVKWRYRLLLRKYMTHLGRLPAAVQTGRALPD